MGGRPLGQSGRDPSVQGGVSLNREQSMHVHECGGLEYLYGSNDSGVSGLEYLYGNGSTVQVGLNTDKGTAPPEQVGL
jgi:hypothetical protein